MNNNVYNTEIAVAQPTIKPQVQPYKLVDQSDRILITKTKEFDFNDPNLNSEEIADRLIQTAKLYKIYSLTANQVGLPYNIFVAGAEDTWVGFFNAQLISSSNEEVLIAESDISNIGLTLYVKRPKSATVQYQDFSGETKLYTYDGLTSRIVQQCLDRINGIDFKSKVSKFVLDRAQKSLNKKIKKFVRSNIRVKK